MSISVLYDASVGAPSISAVGNMTVANLDLVIDNDVETASGVWRESLSEVKYEKTYTITLDRTAGVVNDVYFKFNLKHHEVAAVRHITVKAIHADDSETVIYTDTSSIGHTDMISWLKDYSVTPISGEWFNVKAFVIYVYLDISYSQSGDAGFLFYHFDAIGNIFNDYGLSIFSGGSKMVVGCYSSEVSGLSPLNAFINSQKHEVAIVDTTDSSASPLRTYTNSQVKSIAKV